MPSYDGFTSFLITIKCSIALCVYTQVRVPLCVLLCVCTKVCVCLTLKGRMQIADEYAAAPYREMIA